MKNNNYEEKIKNLYYLSGEGLRNLQYVEEALSFYLTLTIDIKDPGIVLQEDAKKIREKYQKKTLGQAITTARENTSFPEEVLKKLEDFKENRNWFIHNSLYTHREYLFDKTTLDALTTKISHFSIQALETQKLISEELEKFVVSKGIIKERIDEKCKEILKRKTKIYNNSFQRT